MPSRRFSLFSLGLKLGALWPLVLSLNGCFVPQQVTDELIALRRGMEELQVSFDNQGHRVGRIEDFLTYCPDEVQKLVGRVEKECQSSDTCTLSEADIRIEIRNVAPWHTGKLASLIQDRRHVAFFVSPEGRELKETEKKLLRDLVQPAWLNDGARRTRFLVVSYASDNEPMSLRQASIRGKYVIKEISGIAQRMGRSENVTAVTPTTEPPPAPTTTAVSGTASPQEGAEASRVTEGAPKSGFNVETAAPKAPPLPHYILHWALPSPRLSDSLKPEDKPRAPGDKLTSSVFVYRVDC